MMSCATEPRCHRIHALRVQHISGRVVDKRKCFLVRGNGKDGETLALEAGGHTLCVWVLCRKHSTA
jgi:hypothetical protein